MPGEVGTPPRRLAPHRPHRGQLKSAAARADGEVAASPECAIPVATSVQSGIAANMRAPRALLPSAAAELPRYTAGADNAIVGLLGHTARASKLVGTSRRRGLGCPGLSPELPTPTPFVLRETGRESTASLEPRAMA